jgi:hypothetical protein
MNTYQLHSEEYKQEENTVHNILYNNYFLIKSQKISKHKHKHTKIPPKPNQKWATFTYTGKQTTYITFSSSQTKIAYFTNNSIQNLTNRTHSHKHQYSSSGIYQLIYPDCNNAYAGQTGRSFITRYNENKQAFCNNSPSSNFANILTNINTPLAPSTQLCISYNNSERVHI